jgi:hypothetical protein
LLPALAVLLLAVACQNETHPAFSPSLSPTPHTAPTAAILQSADVPAGLNVCTGSGPIDVYLSVLANTDASLANRWTTEWSRLRAAGASAGAISTFTASPTACISEFGATTNVKALSSFVAQFTDAGEADRAWQSGIFGFAPPPPGEVVPGLTRGAGTGLGPSSFTYDVPGLRLACWHRSLFVALVAASNLDLTAFKSATGAIDPRLN